MAPQPGDIIASLFTGAAVILLTNPLDTVKNRFQVAKTRIRSARIRRRRDQAARIAACAMVSGARHELQRLHDDRRRAHRSLPVAARCHARYAKTPGAMAASGLMAEQLHARGTLLSRHTISASQRGRAVRAACVAEDRAGGNRVSRRGTIDRARRHDFYNAADHLRLDEKGFVRSRARVCMLLAQRHDHDGSVDVTSRRP